MIWIFFLFICSLIPGGLHQRSRGTIGISGDWLTSKCPDPGAEPSRSLESRIFSDSWFFVTFPLCGCHRPNHKTKRQRMHKNQPRQITMANQMGCHMYALCVSSVSRACESSGFCMVQLTCFLRRRGIYFWNEEKLNDFSTLENTHFYPKPWKISSETFDKSLGRQTYAIWATDPKVIMTQKGLTYHHG